MSDLFGMGGIPAMYPETPKETQTSLGRKSYQEIFEKVEELLTLASGHDFQNRDVWKKMAQYFAQEADRIMIAPSKEANARLIAAAPELLEACKAFVQIYGHRPALNGGYAMKLARQAIAKAEGKE